MAVNLSIVLSAEATRHAPLPSLPSLLQSTNSAVEESLHSILPQNVQGGFLGGCEQLVWRSCGPTVEVLEAASGIKIAAWTFGAVLRNLNSKVRIRQAFSILYCMLFFSPFTFELANSLLSVPLMIS